jgi:hypothetical protein
MRSRRKYFKGPAYTSIEELAMDVQRGQYVFLWHKPLHPRWVSCMTFQVVMSFLLHRAWSYAIKLEG